jgi:hypothetical protein
MNFKEFESLYSELKSSKETWTKINLLVMMRDFSIHDFKTILLDFAVEKNHKKEFFENPDSFLLNEVKKRLSRN